MTAKTQTTIRRSEQQVARKQYAALAAHYGTIGSAALRAALQFRKPAPAGGQSK
jgi:hypothetical protein